MKRTNETVYDFRNRIARLMNGGLAPVKHAPACLLRRKGDYGYGYPAPKKAKKTA